MEVHLGHAKNDPVANAAGNTRNGKSRKTIKGEFGELPLDIPRDRLGSFEPQLIPKQHQTHWNCFDEKILSLYARGTWDGAQRCEVAGALWRWLVGRAR